MEIKTVTYQCPNCSAALEYNNALGKFKCLFCDSEFTEEDIKKRFAENEGFELSQENLEAEPRKPLRTNPTGRRRSSREPPRSTPARTAARESSATA